VIINIRAQALAPRFILATRVFWNMRIFQDVSLVLVTQHLMMKLVHEIAMATEHMLQQLQQARFTVLQRTQRLSQSDYWIATEVDL
jgi:hypothetical protein